MDIAAAKKQCEAASARVAYWESAWRSNATDAAKSSWYEAFVRDLHDAASGFAAALEALEEARDEVSCQENALANLRKAIGDGALEEAQGKLEAVEEMMEMQIRHKHGPWKCDPLEGCYSHRVLGILRGSKEGE